MNKKTLEDRVEELENLRAIKELADNFSISADKKDGKGQIAMFTEDASVETYVEDKLVTSLKGNIEIGNVFDSFLKTFETVYHSNSQHVISIKDSAATGILYCTVTLISKEKEEKFKTNILVQYTDKYIKENNQWLIAKRTSHFVFQEKIKIN